MTDLSNKISFFYEYERLGDFDTIWDVKNLNSSIELTYDAMSGTIDPNGLLQYTAMQANEEHDQYVSSNSIFENQSAYKAFNALNSTASDSWMSDSKPSNSNSIIVSISFSDKDVVVDSYTIVNPVSFINNRTSNIKSWSFVARNSDNEEWTTIHTVTGNNVDTPSVERTFNLSERVTYKQYGLIITDVINNNAIYCAIAQFKLMLMSTAYKVNLGTYVPPSIKMNEILDIRLKYEGGLPSTSNIVIPMSSDTSNNQLVTASSLYNVSNTSYAIWKAFNGTASSLYDCWCSNGTPSVASPQWIKIDFGGVKKTISSYSVRNRTYASTNNHLRTWTLEGLIEGTRDDWIILDSRTSVNNTSGATRTFDLSQRATHTAFRIVVTQSSGGGITIGNIDLFGFTTPEVLTTDLEIVSEDITWTIPNFVDSYEYGYPLLDQFGYRDAISNSFKPIISDSISITENDDSVIMRLGSTSGYNNLIGVGTLTELRIVHTNEEPGLYDVPVDEVGQKYRVIPFNEISGLANAFIYPNGEFKLSPGRYYFDVALNLGMSLNSQLYLWDETINQMVLMGVGSNSTNNAAMKTQTYRLTGFTDILNNHVYSLRALSYDLGCYVIFEPNETFIVNRAMIYKVEDFPANMHATVPAYNPNGIVDSNYFSVVQPMTSNEDENQLILTSSDYDDGTVVYSGYNAFTGSTGNYPSNTWVSALSPTENSPEWITIVFKNIPKLVKFFSFSDNTAARVTKWRIEARDSDVDEWVILKTFEDHENYGVTDVRQYSLDKYYEYYQYRFVVLDSRYHGQAYISNLKYYCTDNYDIGLNVSSVYSTNTGHKKENVFVSIHDKYLNSCDGWASENNAIVDPQWYEITYKSERVIKSLLIGSRQWINITTSARTQEASTDFILQGYDELDDTWKDIFISPLGVTVTIAGNFYLSFNNEIGYKKYRVYYIPINQTTLTQPFRAIGQLQLFESMISE